MYDEGVQAETIGVFCLKNDLSFFIVLLFYSDGTLDVNQPVYSLLATLE